MRICNGILIILSFFVISCESDIHFKEEKNSGLYEIKFCKEKIEHMIGKDIIEETNSAHVEFFREGFTVGFTHGVAGTFGKRDKNYKMIIACGVSTKQGYPELLVLRSPTAEDYYFNEGVEEYSDFNQEVVEMLFYREDDEFKFCCSQKFGENNIQKHNPDMTW